MENSKNGNNGTSLTKSYKTRTKTFILFDIDKS